MLRSPSSPWLARVALALVAIPCVLNAATGPMLAITVPAAADLPASTSPDARVAIEEGERLLGVLLTGFSLMGLVLVALHHARPSMGTLVGLLALGATFAGMTTVIALRGGDLAAYYGVQTVLIALGVGLYAATRREADESDAASPA